MADDLSPRPSGVLHQFSFVDALVAGLYEGAFRASDVLGAGDFGVGCGDALDGEIVLLDGVMHFAFPSEERLREFEARWLQDEIR